MEMIKKWWFYLVVPVVLVLLMMVYGGDATPVAYKDYFFHGVSQNRGIKGQVEVRFLIKGFPHKRHTTYIELIYPDGTVDFLRSEEHTRSHNAHVAHKGKFGQYKAIYKVPKDLKPGTYKLLIRFEFDTKGWGRLNRDVYVSNGVKFEII